LDPRGRWRPSNSGRGCETHEAYLISDRNGPTRSYYHYKGGCLSISNSRRELIQLNWIGYKISSFPAYYQLLTLGYVIDPDSLLEQVAVTTPGRLVIFARRDPQVNPYFPGQSDCKYFETDSECVTALDGHIDNSLANGSETLECRV